jgi:hypothetical protein
VFERVFQEVVHHQSQELRIYVEFVMLVEVDCRLDGGLLEPGFEIALQIAAERCDIDCHR